MFFWHIALLLKVSAPLFVSAALTTCNAGTYEAGKPAYVTCHFPRHVKSNNLSVNVVRYPLDSNSTKLPKTVLFCNRGKNNNKPQCNLEKGVNLNPKIDRHLRIEIWNFSSNFTGSYVCNIVPPDHHACAIPCNLLLKDTSSLSTPHHDQSPNNTVDADTSGWKTALFTLLAMYLPTTAVAFYIGNRCQKRPVRCWTSQDTSLAHGTESEGDTEEYTDVQYDCTGNCKETIWASLCPCCRRKIDKEVANKVSNSAFRISNLE